MYCSVDRYFREECDGRGMQRGWGRREVCVGFGWRNVRERDHLGDPGIDGRIILGWIFRMWVVGLWTGLGWLRIETGDGQL
jgi:hypothetical protein